MESTQQFVCTYVSEILRVKSRIRILQHYIITLRQQDLVSAKIHIMRTLHHNIFVLNALHPLTFYESNFAAGCKL